MMKMFYAMLPVLLLVACSGATTNIPNSPTSLYATTESPDQPSLTTSSNTILVTGSLTLSRNALFPLTNKREYLSVVLINGEYFEAWSPGRVMGRNWRGKFQIQLP